MRTFLKLSQKFLSKARLKMKIITKEGGNCISSKTLLISIFFRKRQSFNQFEVAFNRVGSDIGIMFTSESECIPVGCVPSAPAAVSGVGSGGVSASGLGVYTPGQTPY